MIRASWRRLLRGFGSRFLAGVGSNHWSVVAAEVNADGKLDLISANYNANTLTVLFNTSPGNLQVVGNGCWNPNWPEVRDEATRMEERG